ncbi:MAG: right-handed parallel beta-helix repeat-containing protein [Donghicola eburneus]|nr:right-handed parallel beta-helix repeat-containing protein [Donghicola eburneus]MCI5040016.1 right-handed parallel beta-helix repeat-containing protein [Donghicola eburneus]
MARLNCAFVRAEDANGNPVNGGKMYIYEAGTSTPVTTYSDSAMSNPQAHPLIADSAGVFATVYIAPAFYKVVITDAADVTLYEADDVLITGEMDYRMRISFDTRAEAESSTTGQTGNDQYIWVENLIFEYSATGTALTTGDGRKWKPAGQALPEHFGAAGDGLTDDTLPLEAWASVATGYIELLPERHYKHNDRTRELDFENDVIVQGSHSKFDFSGWGLTGTTQDFMSRQGSYGAERNVNPAATSTSTNADGWEITKMRVVDNLTDLNPVAHGFSVNSNLKLASDDVVEDRHDAVNEKRGQQSKVAHIGGLLTLTGAVTVVAGETVTQATSGATGVVVDDGALTDNLLRVERITGTFNTSDTLTGSTSGALGANSVPTAIVIDQFEIFGVLHQALSTAPTARTVALANFQIMDLDIIGPGRRSSSTGDTGLRMLACRGFKVSRCRFFNVDYQAISIDDCLNGEVGHNEFVFPPKGDHDSFQAGVAIKNASQNIRVFDNIQDGGKHMVNLTRNETPGITRNIRIYGNMARNVSHSAFASHGNSANCEVSYNKGENCKYLVNPRTPGWKIIGNHLDHGITVVRMTDHVKDHYLQGNSGRNVTYVVHVPASEDLIGETEVGNLTILDTVGHEVAFNTVNISPTMPYLDQTDAAVTGASSTTITVAPFGTVDSVDWDQDGILKHRMISMVWNGGGASAQVREILEHTVTRDGSGNATANVLRVSGWTTNPDPALATYTVYDDTVLSGLEIRGIQSHNCAGPDVAIKGEWKDAVIANLTARSDSAVAQACLAIFGIGGKDGTGYTLQGLKWRNKDAPAISATVEYEWRDDMTPRLFGAIGDGEADDFAAIDAVDTYAAARGVPVVWDGATYHIDPASGQLTPGARWAGKAVLDFAAKASTNDAPAVAAAQGFAFETLAVTLAANHDRGVQLNGASGDDLTITYSTFTAGNDNDDAALRLVTNACKLSSVTISGHYRALKNMAPDSRLGEVVISDFVQGFANEADRARVGLISATGTNASATGAAGENPLLHTDGDHCTYEEVYSENAGEHAVRIAGESSHIGLEFGKITAINPGGNAFKCRPGAGHTAAFSVGTIIGEDCGSGTLTHAAQDVGVLAERCKASKIGHIEMRANTASKSCHSALEVNDIDGLTVGSLAANGASFAAVTLRAEDGAVRGLNVAHMQTDAPTHAVALIAPGSAYGIEDCQISGIETAATGATVLALNDFDGTYTASTYARDGATNPAGSGTIDRVLIDVQSDAANRIGGNDSENFDIVLPGVPREWSPNYDAATAFTSDPTIDAITVAFMTENRHGVVNIWGGLRTDAISGGSGNVRLKLPRTVADTVSPDGNFGALNISFASSFSGDYPSSGYFLNNTELCQLIYRTAANGATSTLDVTDLNTGANGNWIMFSGTYHT